MRVFRTLVKLRERTFHWLVQRNLPCACIEASGKGFGKYITFKGISRDSLFCMPLESWEFQMPGLYYCFWFHCLWLFEMLGEEKKTWGLQLGICVHASASCSVQGMSVVWFKVDRIKLFQNHKAPCLLLRISHQEKSDPRNPVGPNKAKIVDGRAPCQ